VTSDSTKFCPINPVRIPLAIYNIIDGQWTTAERLNIFLRVGDYHGNITTIAVHEASILKCVARNLSFEARQLVAPIPCDRNDQWICTYSGNAARKGTQK
jgi:hypothetical protein